MLGADGADISPGHFSDAKCRSPPRRNYTSDPDMQSPARSKARHDTTPNATRILELQLLDARSGENRALLQMHQQEETIVQLRAQLSAAKGKAREAGARVGEERAVVRELIPFKQRAEETAQLQSELQARGRKVVAAEKKVQASTAVVNKWAASKAQTEDAAMERLRTSLARISEIADCLVLEQE